MKYMMWYVMAYKMYIQRYGISVSYLTRCALKTQVRSRDDVIGIHNAVNQSCCRYSQKQRRNAANAASLELTSVKSRNTWDSRKHVLQDDFIVYLHRDKKESLVALVRINQYNQWMWVKHCLRHQIG